MAGNEISGFAEFAEELEDAADDFGRAADDVESDGAVDRGVQQTAESMAQDASRNAPRDTGRLANSIRAEQVTPGQWRVIADVPYAQAVEYGRGPVSATDAEALRFEVGGEVIFRQSVGPAEAQPYLRPALDAHRSELVRNIRSELRQTLLTALNG